MCQAETVIQPSLHTVEEYASMVLTECESRGIDVTSLRMELNGERDHEGRFTNSQPSIDEIIRDAFDRLDDANYAHVEENDTLLIWPQGEPLPDEWAA